MDSSVKRPYIDSKGLILSRKEIFLLLKDHLKENYTVCYEELKKSISLKFQRSFILSEKVKIVIRRLVYQFRVRWQTVKKSENRFYNKYSDWLEKEVCLEDFASSREKKTRSNEISQEKIKSSTDMNKESTGKIISAENSNSTKVKSLSVEKALAFIIDARLSKYQYQGICNANKQHNCDIFPAYKAVFQTRQDCYPFKSSMALSQITAEVKLQALLEHTTERILKAQVEKIKFMSRQMVKNLRLICIWGSDSFSAQIYKEIFGETKSEIDIFCSSLIPLRLESLDSETIVWKNPQASSLRNCRPIKINFLQKDTKNPEDKKKFTDEEIHMKQQIKNLVPVEKIIDGKEITVSYEVALTKIFDKFDAPAQHCYVCKVASKDFNDFDVIFQQKKSADENFKRPANKILRKEVKEETKFNFSTSHAWIHFFECCLQISYNLEVKKCQQFTAEETESIRLRKENIQRAFWKQLDLVIDENSRFGIGKRERISRRFFRKSSVSASITGLNEDLIKSFNVILQAITSGWDVVSDKLQNYTFETTMKFVSLYQWFPMPATMHTILSHGSRIINSSDPSLLPIGQMPDEARKFWNKNIEKFRENFTGMNFQRENMDDLIKQMFVTSDPLISSLSRLSNVLKLKSLSPEAKEMLVLPAVEKERDDTSDEESSDSEYEDSSDDGF